MEFGPIAKMLMKLVNGGAAGVGGGAGAGTPAPSAPEQAPAVQGEHPWITKARTMLPDFNSAGRIGAGEAANGIGDPNGWSPSQSAAPQGGGMTPEQQSDWQAVGLGQMKLGEYQAKYGSLPQ